LNLAGGHFCSLRVALVIESHQVQDPVDGEMRPMCPQRFILSTRFERDEGRAREFKLRLRALPTMRTDRTWGPALLASAASAHLLNSRALGTQGLRDA